MNDDRMTAPQVDAWIASCYDRLRQRVMMTCYFDEDVFQDAYLALRDTGAQAARIEAEFIKLYRTLLSRDFSGQMRYTHPDPLFFTLLSSDSDTQEDSPEDEPDPLRQAHKVDSVCRALLSAEDYTLYNLRYKIGLTLREIAAYTGRTAKTILSKLNDITARIRAFFSPAPAACIA